MKLLLSLALMALAQAATAASPVASFTAHRTSCFAPCDVYFDASGTTDADLSTNWERFIDLAYSWDFGDPGAGNWTRGAAKHSKNVDTGQVAGHVYDSAGTYVVTLTVIDASGNSSQDTETITVTAQDDSFPTTNTVCVNASGSDWTGCPSGATTATNSDFDNALQVTCNVDASAKRCLFKRGDTFTVSAATDLHNSGNIVIGAFGSGAKPIVNMTGGFSIIEHPDTAFNDRIIVQDITFNGEASTADQTFYTIDGVSARHFFSYRVDLTNMRQTFDMYGGGATYDPDVTWPDTGAMPNNISIVETTSTSGPNSNGALSGLIMFYSSTDRMLFMGNDFGDMESDEQHILRLGWWNGLVLSHNDLGRGCGSSQHVLKMHNHKEGESTLCSRRAVIADNLIEGCQDNDLDVEIGPNSTRGQECTEQVVFERNILRQENNTKTSHRSIVLSGEGYVARNNVVDLSGTSHTSTARGITVRLKDPSQLSYKPPRYIRLYNNTCYQNSTASGSGECLILEDSTDVSDVIVKNNLLYDPSGGGTPDLFVNSGAANLTLCSGGSETPCNLTTSTNPFDVATPFAFAEWELAIGAAPRDDGELILATNLNFAGDESNRPQSGDTALHIGAWQDDPGGGGGGGGDSLSSGSGSYSISWLDWLRHKALPREVLAGLKR